MSQSKEKKTPLEKHNAIFDDWYKKEQDKLWKPYNELWKKLLKSLVKKD